MGSFVCFKESGPLARPFAKRNECQKILVISPTYMNSPLHLCAPRRSCARCDARDRASFSLLPGALQGQRAKITGEGWPNARFLATAARDNKNTRGSGPNWEKICFKWVSSILV